MVDYRYNPIRQPCIPIEGAGTLSIYNTLTQASSLGQVQADTPTETAAALRLLLAIVLRACGPTSYREASEVLRAKTFPAKLKAYLDLWEPSFELFDPLRPFLQIGGMEMAQKTPLAALAMEAATGNNATLFDHTSDEAPPAFTPAQAFLKLLAFQQFALGFGRAADATLKGSPLPRPYLADAPALRGFTLWLSGESLLETLILNMPLVSGNEDPPLWERKNVLERLDKVVEGKRVSVRSFGALDTFVWQSRMVRLLPEESEGQTVVRYAYVTQGREADKTLGDPMKVYVTSKDDGVYALNLNADKASWRDLHGLLAFDKKLNKNSLLLHAANLVDEEAVREASSYSINIVGLATDPGKAGKFLLWRHDRLAIPSALLPSDTQEGMTDRLGQAAGDAEFVARELRGRIYSVARQFVPPHGNPDPKDVGALTNLLDTTPAYWSRLESHFYTFLHLLPQDVTAAFTQWRSAVASEAERALRQACNQLGHVNAAKRALGKANVSYYFEADAQAFKQRAKAPKKKTAPKETQERITTK